VYEGCIHGTHVHLQIRTIYTYNTHMLKCQMEHHLLALICRSSL